MNEKLDQIVRFLSSTKRRATYDAVAGVAGGIARGIGNRLGTPRPEASWIVSTNNGRPSKYKEEDYDPDFSTDSPLYSSAQDLLADLENWLQANGMQSTWQRYTQYLCTPANLPFRLDISRMRFDDNFFSSMEDRMQKAFAAMKELESGAIANPDEKRQVGHYWLRDPHTAPDAERRAETISTLELVRRLAADVHNGTIRSDTGDRFRHLLVIGIGGSALGPQFVTEALGSPRDRMTVHFIDNTDPDGIDVVFSRLADALPETLALVISKSGGTKETRNGMLEAKYYFEQAGLDFGAHAIAITGSGSALDEIAEEEEWIERVPMFDYVGGRTSEFSAVGLLPAALQSIDVDEMLAGAAAMDRATRVAETAKNPAALLALMWYHATNGKGEKDMVVLPYKDRLLLFSRYLQQLVMESLGKELDLDGNVVNQGIAVYGNKGSTDQHAYVQQLREGVNNFFVVFIEVLQDRAGHSPEVEDGITTGDYLQGFLLGTRDALSEKDRESLTITIDRVDAFSVGMLIALFERAVGLYASLININAYHQPGVEAGKKAAGNVLSLQTKVANAVEESDGSAKTAEQWAETLGESNRVEHVWMILCHLAANGRGIMASRDTDPKRKTFQRA